MPSEAEILELKLAGALGEIGRMRIDMDWLFAENLRLRTELALWKDHGRLHNESEDEVPA